MRWTFTVREGITLSQTRDSLRGHGSAGGSAELTATVPAGSPKGTYRITGTRTAGRGTALPAGEADLVVS